MPLNAMQLLGLVIVSTTGALLVLAVWRYGYDETPTRAALWGHGAALLGLLMWIAIDARAGMFGGTSTLNPGLAFWVYLLCVESAVVILAIAVPRLQRARASHHRPRS